MEAVLQFVSGCLFFPICFLLFRRIISCLFPDKLSDADASDISVKCVSSIQAVLCTGVGSVIVSSCHDIMADSHWLTNSYACFSVPYFYYDTWAMFETHCLLHPGLSDGSLWSAIKHFLKHNLLMMVHHLVMPLVFFPTILFFRQGQGDFFVGVFYMIELAIPFIAAQSILAQLKMKHTMYYVGSGLLMIGAFAICRILVFPYLYWRYSIYKAIPFQDVPFHIPIKCNMGCLIILLPQLYWLALMIRGASRVFYKIYTRTKLEVKVKSQTD